MSKIQDLRTWMVLNESLIEQDKLGIVTFSNGKGQNVQERRTRCSGWMFDVLEREGVHSL